MPDISFVSMMVGVGGLIVAVVTLMIRSKEGFDEHAKFDATVGTKLDFISEDVKDIKADTRIIQRDISEVREIAITAKKSAEAANRRLDCAGIGFIKITTDEIMEGDINEHYQG